MRASAAVKGRRAKLCADANIQSNMIMEAKMYYGSVISGRIILKACEDRFKKEVKEYIRGNIAEELWEEEPAQPEETKLGFSGSSIECKEGLFIKLFEKIEGFCSDGEIDLCGEDWRLWRYKYDSGDNKWKTQQGSIVYK